MKINKEWHLAHKMPKNATTEERIQWHLAHHKACGCHPAFPVKLVEEMKKRNIPVPGEVVSRKS